MMIIAGLGLSARANYPEFPDVKSGSDIVVQELAWPYWNSGYYNTWVDSSFVSVEGASGGFYNGVPLPAAGSPAPAEAGINFSFWALNNPINISDTVISTYSSPTTFPRPDIAEGTILEDPGTWYFWQTNLWFRVAIRTWQPVNGPPHVGYAGNWIRDPATGNWYHMATVQLPFEVTGLASWGGFQEDIGGGSTQPQRTNYRRLYYHYNGMWNSATNFYDYNQSGTNGFPPGAGMVDNAGLIQTNTAVYLETCQNNSSYVGTITNEGPGPNYVISQPATPTFFDPILVTNFSGAVSGNQLLVQWQIPITSSPQFAYQINVFTNASFTGNVVATSYDIAPDARQQLLTIPAGITPYPQLTIIDVFNQTNAPVSCTPTNATLSTATGVSGAANGLNFAYYQSAGNVLYQTSGTNWSSMPNFTALIPVLQGALGGLDLTPRLRRDGYAFNYTGYISVPSNGLYTFTLNSDAGSKLYVDGQLVVNWDGEHSPSDLSGWIGLQAGDHTLNVQYFCDTQPYSGWYFDSLSLSYQGPGITEAQVPASAFFYVPNGSAPSVTLSSPTNGATISGASVPLSASVTANGNTINNVQFYVGENYWAADASPPYNANSLFWSTNDNPIRARVIYNTSNIIDSTISQVTTTNMSLGPWQFGQIFYHNYPNGVSIQNGTYSVIGDGVNLLTRQVSGNCTLIAHLSGLPTTAPAPDGSTPESGWEAGIILRGNTNMTPGYPWGEAGTAPFTAVFGEVGGGAYYQDESMANGGGGYASSSLGSQTWFEIQRTNNMFISSVSSDGVHWTPVWTNSLTDFGATVDAGFFTYAQPDSNLNVMWAGFNQFSLNGNILGPPGVTVIPQSDTLYTGQNITLTAQPSGNAPFAYQWQLNGDNISGATNTTLILANLQPVASGLYSVVLNNSNGTATAASTITVLTPPASVTTVLSNNPVGYWRLNETAGPTAYDTLGNFNGTGQGGVAFGVPGVTNSPFTGFGSGNLAAQFGGDSSPSDIAIPPFDLSTTNFTITGWVNCNGVQDSWSGLVFSRSGTGAEGLMVVNNGGNELRYSWNNDGNDYNASTGLILPQGQWAFVGLTITPTQAIVYFATNSTLQSWTNVTANTGQTFNNDFYFGCDPTSLLLDSRQFDGSLDEIAIYNQTLSATQISGILTASEQAAQPAVNLTTPANNAGFAAPATINLSANVSTNGHTINNVQFYDGSTLLGQSTTTPYTYNWTSVPAGTYTLLAQVNYDSGSTVSSVPVFVSVNPLPVTPSAPVVTAPASNLINVTWTASAFATSYSVLRDGSTIATLNGTNYQDIGLAANSNYCYSIMAINSYGDSSPGPSSCVTTLTAGGALAWDALQLTGAQDGNGNWGSSATTWWNGSSTVAWSDNNLAVFGTGTSSNCTAEITNNVTPSGILFNANNGGTYTLAGSGGELILSGDPVFTLNNNATISAVMAGSGGFTQTGAGMLTLSAAETYTGTTTVEGGTLLLNAYRILNSSPIVIENGAVVEAIVSGGNAFQYYGQTVTVETGGTLTLGNGSFSNLGGYLYLQGGATFGGADSGSWGSWQINDSDNSIHVTNGSPVAAVISAQGLHGASGKALIFNVADVTGNNLPDLIVSGTLTTGGGDNSNYGIAKTGAGTMVLSGINSYIGTTVVSNGVLQVDGAVGTNTLTVATGGTLAGAGLIGGATAVQAGGIMSPGDGNLGTLSLSKTLALAGNTVMGVSKIGGTDTNAQVSVTGAVTYGGTLTVTNLGTNVLIAGDSFQLFKAAGYTGSFSSLNLPALSTGLIWNTANLSVNGTISVAYMTYILTYGAGANGTISGASPQTVNYGGNGTAVTAVANSGYTFTNWSDGSIANPRTDTDVTANISVTANFIVNTNSPTGYASQILALGPNSYWRLNETNGSTTLIDASGNSHNANPQGTGLVLGVAGPQSPAYPQFETTNTAAQFNGVSNWISCGTAASLSGTNDFTLSAWIRTTAVTNGIILQQRDATNYNGEYQLGVNPNGTVNFYLYGNGGYQFNLTTTQAVNDGQWHTVMAERSAGTNGYIFIDGMLVASANGTDEPLLSTINTYIGRDVRNVDDTFNGQIDEVAIFNQALSSNQVAQLANTNHYNLPSLWSTNTVGAVATETTATYFSQAFSVGGGGAGLASSSDSFWFVKLPLTNSLTITAKVGSFQTNGPAPLAGVMVRQNTNVGAVFAFMGMTPTNSAKWIYRSTVNGASSSTTFKNLPLPYWVRLVRSTNTFTGYVSSNGVSWVESASVNITSMASNALAGLVVSTGASNILNTAIFDNVTVTNGGVLIYQPQILPGPAPAVAGMGSFVVESGNANFTITGDDGSMWQIEESDDLINWTPIETVTLIGGSVIQSQANIASPAQFYRLVQVN